MESNLIGMSGSFPAKARVFVNGEEVKHVRSVDIRIAAQEVQQATIVLLCDDIQIAEDGTIYLKSYD